MDIRTITHSDTFWPIITSALLMVILLFLPTGYEGAISYKNADRVTALVLAIYMTQDL